MIRNFIIVITAIMLSYITGCTEREKSAQDVQPPQMQIEDIYPQPAPVIVNPPAGLLEIAFGFALAQRIFNDLADIVTLRKPYDSVNADYFVI